MGFVFLFSFSLFLIIKEAVIFTHLRISLYSVYLNGTDMKSVSSLVKSDICNVTVFHMLLSLCYIFFFCQTGELLSSGTFLNDGDVKLGNSPH